jgi:thiamine transport system ATP-binding protein
MSGLIVDGLSVTYPGSPPVRAVNDVSLHIDRGEIVALVGPSGCGKSSLLGAIVGTITPSAGVIRFNGADVTATPVHLRGFGMVFQDGQLFPHRSVTRNIAFGLEVGGVPREERAARVAELLELVGLSRLGTRAVAELSGGERQRVALARSLAPRPSLLALDEPLSSLDAHLRERLAIEVRDILRAAGTTAIVVTHDRSEARVMASRLIEMDAGRLVSR